LYHGQSAGGPDPLPGLCDRQALLRDPHHFALQRDAFAQLHQLVISRKHLVHRSLDPLAELCLPDQLQGFQPVLGGEHRQPIEDGPVELDGRIEHTRIGVVGFAHFAAEEGLLGAAVVDGVGPHCVQIGQHPGLTGRVAQLRPLRIQSR